MVAEAIGIVGKRIHMPRLDGTAGSSGPFLSAEFNELVSHLDKCFEEVVVIAPCARSSVG